MPQRATGGQRAKDATPGRSWPSARFELWQDGMMVACVEGPRRKALSEIRHYALMYGQDGPVEIREK